MTSSAKRARRERPRHRRAAEQRDEIALLHVDFALTGLLAAIFRKSRPTRLPKNR
jgi:hypothetical protein